MANYATVNDVISLWRALSVAEQAKAGELLDIISSEIRTRARAVGKDFDALVNEDPDLALVAKSVCVDVVKRYMLDSTYESPSMSQMSQSAGGYSVSGTFLVPGGGLFLKRSELSRLGLRVQKVGVIDLCG